MSRSYQETIHWVAAQSGLDMKTAVKVISYTHYALLSSFDNPLKKIKEDIQIARKEQKQNRDYLSHVFHFK